MVRHRAGGACRRGRGALCTLDFPGPKWLVLAALTIISGTATVRLPNVKAEISISETFVFSAVLIFGPGAGVLTVLLDAAIINLKMASQRKALRLDRALFNLAAPSLAVWLGGSVMSVAGVPPVHNWHGHAIGLERLIGPLVGFAVVYFVSIAGWLRPELHRAACLAVQGLVRPFRLVVAQLLQWSFDLFTVGCRLPDGTLLDVFGRSWPSAANSLHDV